MGTLPAMAQKKDRSTHRGFGEPASRVTMNDANEKDTDPDLAPPHAGLPGRAGKLRGPSDEEVALDIEQVREAGSPALLAGPWRAFEIWTRNRIYGVDGAMICRSVTDRASGGMVTDHPAIGARLLGGQRRSDDGQGILWVAHPLPARGGAAVFAKRFGKRLNVSETSAVTRVVVRQRVVAVGPEDQPPSWDELTGED